MTDKKKEIKRHLLPEEQRRYTATLIHSSSVNTWGAAAAPAPPVFLLLVPGLPVCCGGNTNSCSSTPPIPPSPSTHPHHHHHHPHPPYPSPCPPPSPSPPPSHTPPQPHSSNADSAHPSSQTASDTLHTQTAGNYYAAAHAAYNHAASQTLPTPRPMTLVRLLLIVRAQMPLEIEPARKRRVAPGDAAREIRILLAPPDGSVGGAPRRHGLLRDRVPLRVGGADRRRARVSASMRGPAVAVCGPRSTAVMLSRIGTASGDPHFLREPRARRRLAQPRRGQPERHRRRTVPETQQRARPVVHPRVGVGASGGRTTKALILQLLILHPRARIRTRIRAHPPLHIQMLRRRTPTIPHLRTALRS
jgi:hypothetical protein